MHFNLYIIMGCREWNELRHRHDNVAFMVVMEIAEYELKWEEEQSRILFINILAVPKGSINIV